MIPVIQEPNEPLDIEVWLDERLSAANKGVSFCYRNQ